MNAARPPSKPCRARLVIEIVTLSCAFVACSSSGTSGAGAGSGGKGGATGATGGSGGAGSAGKGGATGASATGEAASGGAVGSGDSSTGGSMPSTGGVGGGTGGTVASGGTTEGMAGDDASIQSDTATDTANDSGPAADAGGSAEAGGASTGSCPTTLPILAADSDTSFYANKPNVPHGIVATVKYTSGNKTMHIYTPPDYASNTTATYPALYLNHGVGEDDSVWGCTTGGPECGYAGLILDNLIADGKAVPMIMVMTDTRDCATLDPPKPPDDDACTAHYRQELMPYVEKNYRVKADRNYRAIGGLSLGGIVTFNAGLTHLDLFSQLFIYSSGFFSDTRPTWEANMSAVLKDPKTTNHLLNVPIYMAAGDTDVALDNAEAVRDILKNDGIRLLWQQSTLGHEWANWRRYLAQTLPLMFTNMSGCN